MSNPSRRILARSRSPPYSQSQLTTERRLPPTTGLVWKHSILVLTSEERRKEAQRPTTTGKLLRLRYLPLPLRKSSQLTACRTLDLYIQHYLTPTSHNLALTEMKRSARGSTPAPTTRR